MTSKAASPHARWRIHRPVPIRSWVWDSRGREIITPTDVDVNHKALQQLVAEVGYERPYEIVRLPDLWPFRQATAPQPGH